MSQMEQGKQIIVFGDYDVDGVTSTCVLTRMLHALGTICGTISRWPA